jgi:hypothetical protein
MTTETMERIYNFQIKLAKNPLIKSEIEKCNIIWRHSAKGYPYISWERPDNCWGDEYRTWKDKLYSQLKKEKLVHNPFYGYTTKDYYELDTAEY